MRRLIALSILTISLGSALFISSSWAQEENQARAVNPGEDPNEAKGSKSYEADVAAPGVCPECIARMKHGRLGDDTNFRAKGSSSGGPASGGGSAADGTR